jgi:hypothetical protein
VSYENPSRNSDWVREFGARDVAFCELVHQHPSPYKVDAHHGGIVDLGRA